MKATRRWGDDFISDGGVDSDVQVTGRDLWVTLMVLEHLSPQVAIWIE